MSLRATVMFIVAIDAYGQAPQAAPPAPTKSATAQTLKGKESAIGEPCATLAIIVATLRICGEPKRTMTRWNSGQTSRANASTCVQVAFAPMTTIAPRRRRASLAVSRCAVSCSCAMYTTAGGWRIRAVAATV